LITSTAICTCGYWSQNEPTSHGNVYLPGVLVQPIHHTGHGQHEEQQGRQSAQLPRMGKVHLRRGSRAAEGAQKSRGGERVS
jgi:hypothetical protein